MRDPPPGAGPPTLRSSTRSLPSAHPRVSQNHRRQIQHGRFLRTAPTTIADRRALAADHRGRRPARSFRPAQWVISDEQARVISGKRRSAGHVTAGARRDGPALGPRWSPSAAERACRTMPPHRASTAAACRGTPTGRIPSTRGKFTIIQGFTSGLEGAPKRSRYHAPNCILLTIEQRAASSVHY